MFDENLPKEILNARKQISEMRRVLNKFTDKTGDLPAFAIIPHSLTLNRTPEQEKVDKMISELSFVTFNNIFKIAEEHLDMAERAGKLEDMRYHCFAVNNLCLGFFFYFKLFNDDESIKIINYQSEKVEGMGNKEITFTYGGKIDGQKAPFDKMTGTLRLLQPNPQKTKRIGVMIRTVPTRMHGKEVPPRVNMHIPIIDSQASSKDEENIITVRWDFDSSPQDATGNLRRIVLDLTWFKQNEEQAYKSSLGHLGGHHFLIYGQMVTTSEAKELLERLNEYLQKR